MVRDVRRLCGPGPLPVQRSGKTDCDGVKGNSFGEFAKLLLQVGEHLVGRKNRARGDLLLFYDAPVLFHCSKTEIGFSNICTQDCHKATPAFPSDAVFRVSENSFFVNVRIDQGSLTIFHPCAIIYKVHHRGEYR